MPGTLTSCTAPPPQLNVTDPPGAIFTAAGDQANVGFSFADIEPDNGLPLDAGTVGGGGGLVGTAVAGALVAPPTGALVGAVVGVAAGVVASAVRVGGTEVGDAVPEALTWVAFDAEAGVANVVAAEFDVGSASDEESDPPQAAKTATAPAAKRRTGRRRIVLPR